MNLQDSSFLVSLLSGAAAGTSVDLTLFPLDTVKTRLQSSQGFWKAGGFRGMYNGVASAALGSAPNAALFFVTYDTMNRWLKPSCSESAYPLLHMVSASAGEVVACIVRVPVEVVKQRAQASPQFSSAFIFRKTISSEGVAGLYRGFFSTVMREIPFALIQYPLWELLKKWWSHHQGRYVDSWQASICGATAGGIAAGLTTPMDVAKTRIMLAESGTASARGGILNVLHIVYSEKGIRGLYSGIAPRMAWISIGGAVFFGVYEKTKSVLQFSVS